MTVRIAYALPGTAISGGTKVAFEHIRGLNRLPFFEVHAVAAGPKPRWFDGGRVPLIREDPCLFDFGSFDIIMSTFYNQQILYSKWRHKNLIHFCQGYEAEYLDYLGKEHLLPTIEKFYGDTRLILTVNQTLKEQLSLFKRPTINIGQGLDTAVFRPGPRRQNGRPSLLVVGAYDLPFKGVHNALRLAVELKQMRPEIRIIRVSPHDTSAVEKDIDLIDEYHWGLTPPEMADLYRSSSLTLFLPEKEGFGLPLIESMACGTPVIASEIRPFKEICDSRYPLFKRDDVTGMMKFVLQVLDQPEAFCRLRKIGLEISSRFKYYKVFARLIPILLGSHLKTWFTTRT